MRFFFAGQTLSYFTDTAGLTNIQHASSVDGNTMTYGANAAGLVVIAPQRPVRAYGGFAELGLPLSRWFHADPAGHNAGMAAFPALWT